VGCDPATSRFAASDRRTVYGINAADYEDSLHLLATF
jgi:hypothetical protein